MPAVRSFSANGCVGVGVRYNVKVIIKGSNSTINGLWYIPITQRSEVNPNQSTKPRKKTTAVLMKELNLVTKQAEYRANNLFLMSGATPHCAMYDIRKEV